MICKSSQRKRKDFCRCMIKHNATMLFIRLIGHGAALQKHSSVWDISRKPFILGSYIDLDGAHFQLFKQKLYRDVPKIQIQLTVLCLREMQSWLMHFFLEDFSGGWQRHQGCTIFGSTKNARALSQIILPSLRQTQTRLLPQFQKTARNCIPCCWHHSQSFFRKTAILTSIARIFYQESHGLR